VSLVRLLGARDRHTGGADGANRAVGKAGRVETGESPAHGSESMGECSAVVAPGSGIGGDCEWISPEIVARRGRSVLVSLVWLAPGTPVGADGATHGVVLRRLGLSFQWLACETRRKLCPWRRLGR